MTNLEKLNVRGNNLTELPVSIGNLNNLTRLNIGNNQLTTLPDTLCGLLLLGELSINIECNQLDETNTDPCFHSFLGDQNTDPACN